METQAQCEECCNKEFDLANLNVNLNEISNLKFYQGPQCTIIAVYEKNKKFYMLISYDCGDTFEEHRQIIELEGDIKKIVVLANHSQYVIALLEERGGAKGTVRKRAVSGTLATKDKSTQFSYKQCENFEPGPGEELLDMSCGFRPMKGDKAGQIESVDYTFSRRGDKIIIRCHGHGCIIKE
jgi:hypothetical protein